MAKRGTANPRMKPWALLLAGGLAVACVPETASYLTLPVVPLDDQPLEQAVVEVELAELVRRMAGFRAEDLAFYHLGRQPVPHQLRDTDGDGIFDIAVLVIPVPLDGAKLTAVCPGPGMASVLPSGGVEGGVEVKYKLSYR